MAAKGQTKSGGRKKGTPNRLGREVRELIREALDQEGGTRYLRRAARENPQAFLALVGRLLPQEFKGIVESDVTVHVVTGIPNSPGSAIGTAGTQSERFHQDFARQQVVERAAAAAVPVPPEPQALAPGPEPIRPYRRPESVPVPAPEPAPSEPKPQSFGNISRRPESKRQAERWGESEDAAERERLTIPLKP